MAKNKPYKYNSKSRLTPNSQSFPFKVKSMKKDVKENLENTLTKLKIIEDTKEDQPLEGDFLKDRFNKKNDKKKKDKDTNKEKEKDKEKKEIKEKVEEKEKKDNKEKKEKKNDNKKDNEEFLDKITFFRKLFLTLSLVCAILLLVLFGANFISKQFPNLFGSAKNRIIVKDKSEKALDDNYLFVGDFYTKQFVFKNYGADYRYVNISTDTLTTKELLNHMKDMVYDYNPSVVFLEIGIMDLEINTPEEEYIRNYGRIIDLIKSNRPNAVIIVESIYPVADGYEDGFFKGDITNKKIEARNKALKELAKEKGIDYLDLHSLLLKKGELDAKYTYDGIHLNKDGYQVLYQEISSIIG